MLKKRLEGSHGKRAEELHGVLWAYRTTPKTATGETPYSLVYGSEAIIPTEMHVRTTVSGSTSQEENNELMALSLDLLAEKGEAAWLRNWSNQQDFTYNKKVRTMTFQQGDWVLRRAEKTTGKLTPGWEGPYNVIEVRRAGAYRLQDGKGSNQNPASQDVESSEAWHLGHNTHTSTLQNLPMTSCRSRIQHRNSIVASFQAAKCEIQTGTGSSRWRSMVPVKN
ncbi:uncharacterized protein LOC125587233 [Brassica napus]|uniref:uncharacterized protein LOC125587233 n=1 Tax=Brassica napus TaxID=3708 RepID=UPI00207A7AB5|nr:uncharacterized protein LOC125587233 [Brassica napus]